MAKKSGLGRGLDALIPTGEIESTRPSIHEIPLAQIQPNPRQPRTDFPAEELEELADSIRENGIIQPLILTPTLIPGQYILVAGERRLRAAAISGLDHVPAIIRDVSDEQLLELALIENLQREDLRPLETAEAYRLLIEEFHLTHEQIAIKVGKNRVTVTNALRLLKLPDEAKQALNNGQITEGHARALLALPTEQGQLSALHTVIVGELNVRQTEMLVQKMSGARPQPRSATVFHSELRELEDRLRASLDTRVKVNHGPKGGSIIIHFYSDEELDHIVQKIIHE
jgi:ParB family chromosome partitioning protein